MCTSFIHIFQFVNILDAVYLRIQIYKCFYSMISVAVVSFIDDGMRNADESGMDAKAPLPDMTGGLALQCNATYFSLSFC